MILVKVNLTAAEAVDLKVRVASIRATLPGAARISEGSFLAALVRADLATRKVHREREADRLTRQYTDVWMAWAARCFRKIKGAIQIEDIQTWSYQEARKAMVRFDPTMGHSPASLMKTWLDRAYPSLMESTFNQAKGPRLIFIDGDADGDDGRSRWEEIGDADATLEAAPERSELRAALAAFLAVRSGPARRAVKLMGDGEGDDQISAKTGMTLAEIAVLREELRAALKVEADSEITPSAAEAKYGIATKSVYKALSSGKIQGRKRDGQWWLRESDVRGLARAMAAKEAA